MAVEDHISKFWNRVDKTDSCWVWTGTRTGAQHDYGRFYLGNGKRIYAHRFSYELHVGPIPEGLQLDHLCRNPPCVNPNHLEVVTSRENTVRGTSPSAKAARQTRCINGHDYNEANTYRYVPVGSNHERRYCRVCARARQAKRWRAAH